MSQRDIMSNVLGISCGACALAGILLLSGCGSEPTGDAAFSQKFEIPPEAANAANQKSAPPPLTRAEEREKDKADALKRKSKKSR